MKILGRGSVLAYWLRGSFVGVRAFGWQIDYHIDGWLPLFARHGLDHEARVVGVGRGFLTLGRVLSVAR